MKGFSTSWLTTPPPPNRDSFAAFTIEVTPRSVIDVRMRETLLLNRAEGWGGEDVEEAGCSLEDR